MSDTFMLGAVNWLVTLILVESFLFEGFRSRVGRVAATYGSTRFGGGLLKLQYLVNCHLCTGTWVGLVMALAVSSYRPFGAGFVGWALAGLTIKAFGHLTLEVACVLRELSTRLNKGD